jgi:hypothetical protein
MGRRKYKRYKSDWDRPRRIEMDFWTWLKWVLSKIFGDSDIGGRTS